MAKLKTDPIQLADMQEHLQGASDFSFEMSVLCSMRDLGMWCKHSGHYVDPVTQKSREFDIRATIQSANSTVRFAIECKNIRDHFPILVSCMRRTFVESNLGAAVLIGPSAKVAQRRKYSVLNIKCRRTATQIYDANEWVAKHITQVGRNADTTSSLTSNDSEVYDKWGQALASTHDLVLEIANDEDETDKGGIWLGFVFPVIVVPDGRLWSVDYEENGRISTQPRQVDRVSFYVGKKYSTGGSAFYDDLDVTHLEIMTQTGLVNFIKNVRDDENFLISEEIRDHIQQDLTGIYS